MKLDTRTVDELRVMLAYERDIESKRADRVRVEKSRKKIARLEAELTSRLIRTMQ